MKKNMTPRRIMAILLSLLLVLGVVAPVAFILSASATPEELPLTYFGDRNACKMPKEMAMAYANAIDIAQSDGFNKCALIDVAQDGMPLLILCRTTISQDSGYSCLNPLNNDLQIWVWNGSYAQKFTHPELHAFDYNFGWYKDYPVLRTNDWQYGSATGGASFFRIKGGNMTLMKTFSIETGPFYFIDGEPVSQESHDSELYGYFSSFYTPFQFGELATDIITPFSECSAYSDYLKTYAGAFTDYSGYADVTACMHMVAEAAADSVLEGSELYTKIYELIQNKAFYVIIDGGNGKQGVLVRNVGTDDNPTWYAHPRNTPPLTQEELDKAVYDLKYSSNVPLDYNEISSMKDSGDLTYYLENAIISAGEAPNDAAVNELILFAETAISNFCTKKMRTFGNKITLGLRFRSVLNKAREAKKEVEELFYAQSIPLNNPIDIVVPVLWKNCNIEKDCKIYTKDYTYEILQGTELRLYLGDSRHYLQFNTANTDLSFYGDEAYYAFRKIEDNKYSIRVMNDDEPNNPPARIGIGLPADTETATVIANYESGAENQACQYDAVSKLVFFETDTYGVYEVVDNYVDIGDISHLSSESQKAIQFLVSKGIMELTDGNFNPDEGLNRYQFTQAIVSMFFANSTNHTTTFSDVPADHPYYSYVASGQAENIVEGFDDNTFRGDDAMPVQQMLALASRTLVNKKGYTYPADPSAILNQAYIEGEVDGWAQEAVAMALRDGLWDFDDTLYPQETITREQAAVVLYRLFLLLQEVSVLELNTATNIVLVATAVIASAAIVVCIVLIVILIKKNNEINKRKKGNR